MSTGTGSGSRRWPTLRRLRPRRELETSEEVVPEMCAMCWMMVPLIVLGIVLLTGVIAAAVVAAVWAARRTGHLGQPAETPLEILKQRYARGAISPEQFETMKQQLAERPQTAGD